MMLILRKELKKNFMKVEERKMLLLFLLLPLSPKDSVRIERMRVEKKLGLADTGFNRPIGNP